MKWQRGIGPYLLLDTYDLPAGVRPELGTEFGVEERYSRKIWASEQVQLVTRHDGSRDQYDTLGAAGLHAPSTSRLEKWSRTIVAY